MAVTLILYHALLTTVGLGVSGSQSAFSAFSATVSIAHICDIREQSALRIHATYEICICDVRSESA